MLVVAAVVLVGGALLLFDATKGRDADARTGVEPDPVMPPAGAVGPRPPESNASPRVEAGAPSPSPDDEVTGNVLRIEARTPSDARVPALFVVEDGEEWRTLGRSDGAAPLEVARDRLAFPARLRARSSGSGGEVLVGRLLVESDPEDGLVVVRLGPAGVVRGNVVDQDGLPVPDGVRVVVIDPACLRRWIRDPDGERIEDGTWGIATTDAEGRFEVSGLIPDRRFEIHAGGRGLATNVNVDRAVVACDEEPRTVQAFPLFIGVMRIGSPETDALVREQYRQWEWSIRYRGWPKGSFPTHVNHHPALLGTVVEEEARRFGEQGRSVFMLTGTTDEQAVALKIDLRFPFLAEKQTIEIPRFDPRGIAEVLVDVEPRSGPFGAVDVVFLVPPGLERLDEATRVGSLTLRGGGVTLDLPLTASDMLAVQRLENVPYGTYSWSLEIGGYIMLPSLHRRDVEPLELTSVHQELVVDLAWTTSGEIVLVDHDGVPVHRSLTARMSTVPDVQSLEEDQIVTSFAMPTTHWRGPPYVIPFVPPGSYLIDLDAEMARVSLVRGAGPFEFLPSKPTRIELTTRATERSLPAPPISDGR